ncbi:MAG: diaminopimelate epimerase [Christensenellales bacterium]|jgi:diaminopimelate epimerase|nr:diaminopimelate epimerase [Clostridiales bacterium]
MRFTKMHGIGNDYVFINCFEEMVSDPSCLAIQMSQPHFGVGSDGLVLIEPSDVADFAMRIFNADGSEAEMCGNATRCIGKYVFERGMTDKKEITLETKGGIRTLWLTTDGRKVSRIKVDMGSPELRPGNMPVNLPGDTVIQHQLHLLGQDWLITCVNMGNPHCVVFVNDPEMIDIKSVGPVFENHSLFPRRTNVEFVRVVRRDVLQMRVWERGAGETLACGTGASAALVAGVLTGQCDRTVQVKLLGGNLELCWNEKDNHVYQSGPAEYVFDGEWFEQMGI